MIRSCSIFLGDVDGDSPAGFSAEPSSVCFQAFSKGSKKSFCIDSSLRNASGKGPAGPGDAKKPFNCSLCLPSIKFLPCERSSWCERGRTPTHAKSALPTSTHSCIQAKGLVKILTTLSMLAAWSVLTEEAGYLTTRTEEKHNERAIERSFEAFIC